MAFFNFQVHYFFQMWFPLEARKTLARTVIQTGNISPCAGGKALYDKSFPSFSKFTKSSFD